jgi:uncharacterized protein (TIGR02145 family)
LIFKLKKMKNRSFLIIIGILIIAVNSSAQKTGTFKDSRDGKTYKTVKIGTQTWMAENLAYKIDGACWAFGDVANNVEKYGYLYNWEAAKKACPAGWHLPSDAEWNTLITYLGGKDVAGRKMKTTTGWNPDSTLNGTNESGFCALPAGERLAEMGMFSIPEWSACFWSETPLQGTGVWTCLLLYTGNEAKLDIRDFQAGVSVRCVKD